MPRTNELGQIIGDPLPEGWSPPPFPSRVTLIGPRARVEPLNAARHTEDLFESFKLDTTNAGWTYMHTGPFPTLDGFQEWMDRACQLKHQLYFTYIDKLTEQPIGFGSYLRINPAKGSIEVGSIRMSPLLQRTPLSTEVMHLMMKHAFDLGYRRYEWKCDALNEPSRNAALRLGFRYEGTFRQGDHYRGRNRDTAWFAIIDQDWPPVRDAQLAWLSPDNFDNQGMQKQPLSTFMSMGSEI